MPEPIHFLILHKIVKFGSLTLGHELHERDKACSQDAHEKCDKNRLSER